MDWQKKTLNLLIDKREASRAYRGEGKIRRQIRIRPEEIFPAYQNGTASVEDVERFEREMIQLEHLNLLTLRWARRPLHLLEAILPREDAWPAIYDLARRREKNDLVAEQLTFYRSAGETEVSQRFCAAEAEKLARGRKPAFPPEKAALLVDLLDTVVTNQGLLLERELSMRFFSDSKTFEKSYRKPLVDLLLAYGDRAYPLERMEDPANQREKQILVLSEHGIEPNPSYLFWKGDAELIWKKEPGQLGTVTTESVADGGRVLRTYRDLPQAFLTGSLDHLEHIRVHADFVLTVENLTAYHRVREPRGLCLFLSGFHTTGMEKLLRKIGEDNPGIRFLHFGDLDPTGLQILENLKAGTGLPFEPWHMGLPELEKYREYARPLESYDRDKLPALLAYPLWAPIARWMTENNLKLEQEWIAFQEYSGQEVRVQGN